MSTSYRPTILVQLTIMASLAATLAGCSSPPKQEDPAVTAAREARAAEQRAAAARAAEKERQAIQLHNTKMERKLSGYELQKTTWNQVHDDFAMTYRQMVLNPIPGKIAMLSSVRTATQRFDDPSKSTPLVGRIVIGTWKGTKRKGQVLVSYDRHPEHYDVLRTLDFVNNILVKKY